MSHIFKQVFFHPKTQPSEINFHPYRMLSGRQTPNIHRCIKLPRRSRLHHTFCPEPPSHGPPVRGDPSSDSHSFPRYNRGSSRAGRPLPGHSFFPEVSRPHGPPVWGTPPRTVIFSRGNPAARPAPGDPISYHNFFQSIVKPKFGAAVETDYMRGASVNPSTRIPPAKIEKV